MANNVVLFFPVIVILLTTNKIQGHESPSNENEKITLFLKEHEVTNITEVHHRSHRLRIPAIVGAEKSFEITAFGKKFIVDLSIFYPRQDSEVSFYSKVASNSDTFLSATLLLHQGYVRNVGKSFVIGHFNENKLFRGYMITNEVFCIEPHNSDEVIVYRLKDVISPGCSKTSEEGDLDCSGSRYFKPWYVNKAPSARRLFPNYNLLYDNYLEFFHRLQMKKAESRKEEIIKDHYSTDKHHGSENKDKKGHHKYLSFTDKHHGSESKDKKDHHKQSDCHKDGSCEHHKPGGKSVPKNNDREKSGVAASNLISDKSNKTENEYDYYDRDDESDEKEDEDYGEKEKHIDDEYVFKLKDADRFPDSVSDFLHKQKSDWIETSTFDAKYKKKRSLAESVGKYREKAVKREGKRSIEPIVKALEEDAIEAFECKVQVVVAPSLVRKFNKNLEMVTKDVFIQLMLLNKIFFKTPLRVKGKNVRFNLQVGQVMIHEDETYSPFTKRVELGYFKKRNKPMLDYCLQIGLVNQNLKSGDLFDGFTPEGKGGICSFEGNVIMVSHGTENTPVPMAVYFASLLRAVTRAIGASDKDKQCTQGSYPNPMQVLQDYILADEIVPTQSYSIFTKCSIKEIETLLQSRGCLQKVSNPLCGNAMLDPGEECDCGPSGMCRYIDRCCHLPLFPVDPRSKEKKDLSCTLVKGAKCASLQECCSECKIEPEKSLCLNGPRACDIATCDGKSASCPTGAEASNGLICAHNESKKEPLICKYSECDQPLCASFGYLPCTCALGTEKECGYCCLKGGRCLSAANDLKLWPGRNFSLPDGTECMGGLCVEGRCMSPSGIFVKYNHTAEKPPRRKVEAGARNEFSALHAIIGIALSLLALYLLQPST